MSQTGPDELAQRLIAMAEVDAVAPVARRFQGDRHLLRFRADEATREWLEGIVAAQAGGGSPLEVSLSEERGELILSIAAMPERVGSADEIEDAVHPRPGPRSSRARGMRGRRR